MIIGREKKCTVSIDLAQEVGIHTSDVLQGMLTGQKNHRFGRLREARIVLYLDGVETIVTRDRTVYRPFPPVVQPVRKAA